MKRMEISAWIENFSLSKNRMLRDWTSVVRKQLQLSLWGCERSYSRRHSVLFPLSGESCLSISILDLVEVLGVKITRTHCTSADSLAFSSSRIAVLEIRTLWLASCSPISYSKSISLFSNFFIRCLASILLKLRAFNAWSINFFKKSWETAEDRIE